MAIFGIMDFKVFGKEGAPSLLLIPGLGVSYEIFLPLIGLLEERFRIIAVQVDGFTLGTYTRFTSIDDQAAQVIAYVKERRGGRLDCAYGLSLGGKILSRVLEGPLRYYQCANVWTCYHWTGFWRWVFHSHYFDVLLDECRKVYPFGGGRAVLDGYKSVYTNKLRSISGPDIHFWHGSLEAFVARPQARHLQKLCPSVHIEVFPKMNHGQLLVDHPEEVARRILEMV